MQLCFSFLITWRSSSSKSAAVYKISSKSDDFSLRYGDITISKMAAVRHLGTVLPPCETTHEVCCWPQLPVKFRVNLIWRCSYLNFRIFGSKCLSRPPKWGVWGLWTWLFIIETLRRKSASFKLSTVKIGWGVWPVGELTESVTDTHTDRHTLCDTHTQVNLYSVHAYIALDKQLLLLLIRKGQQMCHVLLTWLIAVILRYVFCWAFNLHA